MKNMRSFVAGQCLDGTMVQWYRTGIYRIQSKSMKMIGRSTQVAGETDIVKYFGTHHFLVKVGSILLIIICDYGCKSYERLSFVQEPQKLDANHIFCTVQ